MKAYGKSAKRRIMKQMIVEESSAFIEHCDLIYLWLLHEIDGMGAVRLRRHFRAFVGVYERFKEKYRQDNDVDTLGERCDTIALKKKLAEIGFDYDKEYAEALAELDKRRKGETDGD